MAQDRGDVAASIVDAFERPASGGRPARDAVVACVLRERRRSPADDRRRRRGVEGPHPSCLPPRGRTVVDGGRVCALPFDRMTDPLVLAAPAEARAAHYAELHGQLAALLEGETDWIAAMATVACELHAAFAYFDWTGFYRAVSDRQLVIGPYQGGHGCLRIDFARGVCGAAARTRKTQLVSDVSAFDGHIACAATTQSEIVVPVVGPAGRLLAVLDVDSNALAAFTQVDAAGLERICADLGRRFEATPIL
jgi:L-methionine (R)-S-oxide reductase